MPKLIALLKAPEYVRRREFMLGVLSKAPTISEKCPNVTELIVDVVDVDPGDAEWIRPGETRAAPTSPAYDAVIEVSGHDEALNDAKKCIERIFRATSGLLWLYWTTPMPARVNRQRIVGQSPGVKYVVLCLFHADLPASAAQRSWAHHVPLALRVHVGADIYMRHWVNEVATPGAPPVEGITELHFPTWEDMRERWFINDAGRAQIIQDIGHFLASGTRLYTTEHVFRALPNEIVQP
jgi:hypothetical protein